MPILLEDLVVGAICVAVSMELTTNDICWYAFISIFTHFLFLIPSLFSNMMPLFHVGGIVRNVFAPIFSGGALLCMPAVDPVMFWDLCAKYKCTWYPQFFFYATAFL